MSSIYRIKKATAAVLVASLAGLGVKAQTTPPRPSLVVGIVIDGLSMDYIQLLSSYMGQGGFNRLISNGVTINDLEYGTPLDAAAATAMLYTGAAPAVNGISSASYYDPETRLVKSTYTDAAEIGNFTQSTLSPRSLNASTVGDELRIDATGLGSVYAIAASPEQSLAMAGHAGNSAIWVDPVDGNWASTAYYREMPVLVQTRNRLAPMAVRLDTASWVNLMPIADYPDVPSFKKTYPIRNAFLRKDPSRYRAYTASAPFNSEVTDIAGEYLKSFTLGKGEFIDMLSLGYTVQPYEWARDPEARIEQLDIYLRLDKDLERLFNEIEKGPGLDNTLIFVAGTPRRARSRRDDEKWSIPHGEFSPRRAMSLLNLYLSARYGQGDWINGYHDRNIFLNQNLIKERNLDDRAVRDDVAKFVSRMAGVTEAYTVDDIINLHAGIDARATRNNTCLATAGDVIITVAPGWEIVDQGSDTELHLVERSGVTTAPGFIMWPRVSSRVIETPVDARAVAPTVTRLLRIRSPNAASVPPLNLINNN